MSRSGLEYNKGISEPGEPSPRAEAGGSHKQGLMLEVKNKYLARVQELASQVTAEA